MFTFVKSNCNISFWLCIWITIFISWRNNVFKFFEVSFNCCISCVFLCCSSIFIPLFKFITCIGLCLWLWNCYFFSWVYIVNCNFLINNLSACCWVNYKCYCLVSIRFCVFCSIWVCFWNNILQTIKASSDCCIIFINCWDCSVLIPSTKFKTCVGFCCWWVDCHIFCWIYIEFCSASNWAFSFVTSFYNKCYFLVAFWLCIRIILVIFFWNNCRKFCWFCCYCYISFSNFKCVFCVPLFKLVACFFSYSWFDNCRVTKFYTWIFLNIIIFYFW